MSVVLCCAKKACRFIHGVYQKIYKNKPLSIFLSFTSFAIRVPAMSDLNEVKQIRLENLKALIEKMGGHGAQRKLSAVTGISSQYINNLLRGDRVIGEKTARKIEQTLKLPDGCMDRSSDVQKPVNDVGLDDEVLRLAFVIQSLSSKDRAVLQAMADALSQPKTCGAEVTKKAGQGDAWWADSGAGAGDADGSGGNPDR